MKLSRVRIVEITQGCWLAPWPGEPGQTQVKANAKVFNGPRAAKAALTVATKYGPLPGARIVAVCDPILYPKESA